MKPMRHGDVLIIPTKEEARGKKLNHLVLAEGEVTGHIHQIIEGKAALYEFDDKVYLDVQSKIAKIDHEDHGLKEIPKGRYEIKIRQQHTPEGWKRVQD